MQNHREMTKSSAPRSAKSKKSSPSTLVRKQHMSATMLGTMSLGVLSIIAAFGLGIRSAKDTQIFDRTEASQNAADILGTVQGDIDGNGILSLQDVIIKAEALQGLRQLTPKEIIDGDRDGDYKATMKDILRDLHDLADR